MNLVKENQNDVGGRGGRETDHILRAVRWEGSPLAGHAPRPFEDRTSAYLPPPPSLVPEGGNGNGKGSFVSAFEAPKLERPIEPEQHESLDILVSGDASGVVTLTAHASFPLGCATLSGAFPFLGQGEGIEEKEVEEDREGLPIVCHISLSPHLQTLCACLRQSTFSRSHSRLITVDTSLLHRRCREAMYVASQGQTICELLKYIQRVISKVHEQWSGHSRLSSSSSSSSSSCSSAIQIYSADCAIGLLGTRLRTLDALVRQYEEQEEQVEELTREGPSAHEGMAEMALYGLLVTGIHTGALSQFFSNEFDGTKLRRLRRRVDETCSHCERLLAGYLHPAIDAVLFRVSELRALSCYGDRFTALGFGTQQHSSSSSSSSSCSYSPLTLLEKTTADLSLKTEMLLAAIRDSVREIMSIGFFFVIFFRTHQV